MHDAFVNSLFGIAGIAISGMFLRVLDRVSRLVETQRTHTRAIDLILAHLRERDGFQLPPRINGE